MEHTLEVSHSKAYVNVKWEDNAAAGELASILIFNKLTNSSFWYGTERCSSDMRSF